VSAAGVLFALALGYTLILLATLAAAAIAGILLLRGGALASAATQPAQATLGQAPRERRGVWTAEGTPRTALLVPAEAVDGYQTVLTVDGYALVNAEGRIVYALNCEVRAASSDPVVVTVVDAEMAEPDTVAAW
jgi:hypothetical protein